MRRTLSNFSFRALNPLITSPKSIPHPHPSFPPLASFTTPTLKSYSSHPSSFNETNLAKPPGQNHSPEASNQELKELVDKLYEGDKEVMPDIFEAILKRKLAGVPDDEFMKQLPPKLHAGDMDEDVHEVYSGSDDSYESEDSSEFEDNSESEGS